MKLFAFLAKADTQSLIMYLRKISHHYQEKSRYTNYILRKFKAIKVMNEFFEMLTNWSSVGFDLKK